jgi:hypothetical protein
MTVPNLFVVFFILPATRRCFPTFFLVLLLELRLDHDTDLMYYRCRRLPISPLYNLTASGRQFTDEPYLRRYVVVQS